MWSSKTVWCPFSKCQAFSTNLGSQIKQPTRTIDRCKIQEGGYLLLISWDVDNPGEAWGKIWTFYWTLSLSVFLRSATTIKSLSSEWLPCEYCGGLQWQSSTHSNSKICTVTVLGLGLATFQDKLVEPGYLLPLATQWLKLEQRCVTGMVKAAVMLTQVTATVVVIYCKFEWVMYV